MTTYHWLSLVTCAGQLALAVLAASRSASRSIATVLALLALDLFTWNAADIAADHANPAIWNRVDHFAASFTMPLAFHFLLAFLGRARKWRSIVIASYLYFAGVAAAVLLVDGFGGSSTWAWLIFAVLLPELSFGAWALVRHLGRTRDPDERARGRLVLLAIVIGALFGTTDLLRLLDAPVPRLSNVGTLASVLLLGIAALRFRLLETSLSTLHGLSAAALATATIGAYLIIFASFGNDLAMLALATATITIVAFLALRQFAVAHSEEKSRNDYHATLGRFAQQMAHDLRNPLSVAKGAVQFLEQERHSGRSIDGQGEFLQLIEQQVDRMQQFISEYERIGRVEAAPEKVDVGDLVRSVVSAMQHGVSEKVQLMAQSEGSTECSADRALLARALENLIANAVEAGQTRVVEVRATSDRDGVSISVADDGAGMTPRVEEQAFDDFFTTKTTGSGLGLAFVRRVADAHGGRVSIESRDGRGTIVSLWLPSVEAS